MRKLAVLLLVFVLLFCLCGCMFTPFDIIDYFDYYSYDEYDEYDDYEYDYVEDDVYYDKLYGVPSSALLGKERRPDKLEYPADSEITVMIYLNGSDLEEDYRSATDDILEIIDADLPDNINVVIQTGGTQRWHIDGIDGDKAQRFVVRNNKLRLVYEDESNPNMCSADTLSDFIDYCADNYHAQRNILVLWNHGGGPVEGFGYDTVNTDDYEISLYLDGMQTALEDGGVYFDFIGFDACLMGCAEVSFALCDYSDYIIASEDYESIVGWNYSEWLKQLAADPDIPTPELADTIIEAFVEDSVEDDSSAILTLMDNAYAAPLYRAWYNYLEEHQQDLKEERNIFIEGDASKRAPDKGFFSDIFNGVFGVDFSFEDYCMADMGYLAGLYDSVEAKELSTALGNAVITVGASSENEGLSGVGVIVPVDNIEIYSIISNSYENCGFSEDYMDILYELTT